MRDPEPMVIYNLFPLLAGKFTEWEPHFVRASKMHCNWVFVNPIQAPGKSRSIYSIADYYKFNPLLIDDKSKDMPADQVRAIVNIAKKHNQKLMIDLVLNHCATDSELLSSHPRWFAWDSPGRVAHPWADENGRTVVWEDLAKFDYSHSEDMEGLFQYFFKFTMYLAELGFDGFRCDAAYQAPNSFWGRLIGGVAQKYPEARFFAETLGCSPEQTRETSRAGFDYIFNSAKWWDFRGPWLMQQYNLTRDTAPSISFPESHDTVRLCNELNGNIHGLKQRYLFTALFSAGVMVPIGFEFGFRKRMHVADTRPQDWETTTIDLQEYIANVNKIKCDNSIFQSDGPTQIIPVDNPNVLVLWKAERSGPNEALIILNMDINNKQYFQNQNLYQLIHNGRVPLVDISPEYALDFLPTPFTYDLRPGQGIVLIAS